MPHTTTTRIRTYYETAGVSPAKPGRRSEPLFVWQGVRLFREFSGRPEHAATP